MKATKIGEIRRLSAEENLAFPEEFINHCGISELHKDDLASFKERTTYPWDYRITWAVKVNESLRWALGRISMQFQLGDFRPEMQDDFTYELEEASQQQPTLITIAKDSLWLYQDSIYRAPLDLDSEEILLLIKEQELKKTKRLEKLKRVVEVSETLEKASSRERIPEEVQMFVWRRDGGKCVKCGSQENLEYDHIIPVSKGGANTNRNIQLLCEPCNRSKSDKV